MPVHQQVRKKMFEQRAKLLHPKYTPYLQGHIVQVRAWARAGCEVEAHAVPGKGRGMVASQAEMRVLMAFWARVLSHRPAGAKVPSGGGDLVEVSDPAGVKAVARSRP